VTAPISRQRTPNRRSDVSNEDETRKQAEEDAKEDLELKDEQADKVAGGVPFEIKGESADDKHKGEID
jgi:hypothetical protein